MSTRFKQYTLTLDGTAQRFTEMFDDPSPGGPDDLSFRTVTLQGANDNVGTMFFGEEIVTTALYAFSIPPASAGEADRPIPLGNYDAGPIKLSAFYVLGTSGDHLHVGGITF